MCAPLDHLPCGIIYDWMVSAGDCNGAAGEQVTAVAMRGVSKTIIGFSLGI